MNGLNRFADPVYCLMRLMVGLLFACHGGQKLLGFPPSGHAGGGDAMTMIAGTIELVGGFLIAFGLLTRVAAFLASGLMAVAYFMVHAKGGFFPVINKGELAVVYCFIFLFIFVHGPGSWSLDALIWRNKTAVNP